MVEALDSSAIELATSLYDAGKVVVDPEGFTLVSGRKSDWYCNLAGIGSTPETPAKTFIDPGLEVLVAEENTAVVSDLEFDCVAGVPFKGYSLATAASVIGNFPRLDVRQRAKSHGVSELIEGYYEEDWRVALLESAVTTGGSIIDFADEKLRPAGLVVTDAVAVVDRLEGGKELLAAAGITLHALLDTRTLFSALVEYRDLDPELAEKIIADAEIERATLLQKRGINP